MSFFESLVEAGDILHDIAVEQSEWSQATFGTDAERGPIGPLKHLELEAREAQASPKDEVEYADCLLLILDASRRAGISPMKLLKAAYRKLQINKSRTWLKAGIDEPVMHQ